MTEWSHMVTGCIQQQGQEQALIGHWPLQGHLLSQLLQVARNDLTGAWRTKAEFTPSSAPLLKIPNKDAPPPRRTRFLSACWTAAALHLPPGR